MREPVLDAPLGHPWLHCSLPAQRSLQTPCALTRVLLHGPSRRQNCVGPTPTPTHTQPAIRCPSSFAAPSLRVPHVQCHHLGKLAPAPGAAAHLSRLRIQTTARPSALPDPGVRRVLSGGWAFALQCGTSAEGGRVSGVCTAHVEHAGFGDGVGNALYSAPIPVNLFGGGYSSPAPR